MEYNISRKIWNDHLNGRCIKNNLDFLSQIGDLNIYTVLLGLVDSNKDFNSINDLLNY